MRYRKRWWPQCSGDWCALLALLAAITSTYISQLALVLPQICPHATWWLNAALSTAILYNILANLASVMAVDSSTRGLLLPATCPPGWHYCAPCEATAPPRSWHCHLCGSCILRRDHHCVFTGACVGHANLRYFLMLLFYLALGAGYAACCDIIYICHVLGGWGAFSLLQLTLPCVSLMWQWMVVTTTTTNTTTTTSSADDNSSNNSSAYFTALRSQWVALLCTLHVVGGLFVLALLAYHGYNALHGVTCRERARGVSFVRTAARGRSCLDWRYHVRYVFGRRWYLVWLLPAVDSPLPSDGLSYDQSVMSNEVSPTSTAVSASSDTRKAK